MHGKDKKVELLAPAGNVEKLEIAIHYGADAVYLADKRFSLRNFSGNFTIEEIEKGVAYAHSQGVKVYVACNIYSRDYENDEISEYLKKLGDIRPDAVIVSDPGIIMAATELIPEIPVHLSTQANTTNSKSVKFWENIGVKRINAARELSIKEIKDIADACSAEIEVFVHGAMCMSYSGRCLLSSFLTKRDSNRGMCSHPCRWHYSVMEEQRPGEYMPLSEDDRGAYIFNSKDLCMIAYIPELVESGISSMKIEGRMKSINYVAATVKVYREAIDAYYADAAGYRTKEEWIDQLVRINNRDYCTGFYFGDPDAVTPNYTNHKPLTGNRFAGKVLKKTSESRVFIEVRNKIFKDDDIEVLPRKGLPYRDKIVKIINENGRSAPFAQPGSRVMVELNKTCSANDIIRRIEGETNERLYPGIYR